MKIKTESPLSAKSTISILALGTEGTKPTRVIGLVCTSLCEDRQTDRQTWAWGTCTQACAHEIRNTVLRVEGSPAVQCCQDTQGTSQTQGFRRGGKPGPGAPE